MHHPSCNSLSLIRHSIRKIGMTVSGAVPSSALFALSSSMLTLGGPTESHPPSSFERDYKQIGRRGASPWNDIPYGIVQAFTVTQHQQVANRYTRAVKTVHYPPLLEHDERRRKIKVCPNFRTTEGRQVSGHISRRHWEAACGCWGLL